MGGFVIYSNETHLAWVGSTAAEWAASEARLFNTVAYAEHTLEELRRRGDVLSYSACIRPFNPDWKLTIVDAEGKQR